MTVDQIIDAIIAREGGFGDDPANHGGATKFGVTLAMLRDWRHEPLLESDSIESLSEEEARVIIRQKCLAGPGLIAVRDEATRALVADMIWNHGLRGATLIVQRALGLPGDGVMGPHTLAALNGADTITAVRMSGAFDKVLAERIRFYGRIIERDPSQSRFASGWLDRAADFLAEG